jgi:BlaI family transcriptional regulator, penicillinase repressor
MRLRHRPTGLQQTEWDILAALWELGSASAGEVTKAIQAKRCWAYSTVKTLLKRMATKGLVRARLKNEVWRFSPAYTRLELQQRQWHHFVGMAFDGSIALATEFVRSIEGDTVPARNRSARRVKKAR